jgi:hypothetical protein
MVAWLVLAVPLGCQADDGEDELAAMCIEDHGPADGAGWVSDPGPPPLDGLGTDSDGRPEVVMECDADGHPCDREAIITRPAATCVAEGHGLDPGLDDWSASLVYDAQRERPVWSVTNLLVQDEASCIDEGRAMTIDAQTGALLEEKQWRGQC